MTSPAPVLNLTRASDLLYCSTASDVHSFHFATGSPSASTSRCPDADRHSATVRLVAVSPDGDWLASIADDKLLKVWSVSADRKELALSSSRSGLRSLLLLAAFVSRPRTDELYLVISGSPSRRSRLCPSSPTTQSSSATALATPSRPSLADCRALSPNLD